MSTSYNKKKKKKKSNHKSLNPRTILLIVVASVLFFVGGYFIIDKITGASYYELTEYVITTNTTGDPVVDDSLDLYVYYRIYLNDDDTFTLKLKRNIETPGKIQQEEVYTGTYTLTTNRLTLRFISFPEESFGEGDEMGVAKFDINGDVLTRNQDIEWSTGMRQNIKQTLVLKK